MTRYSRPADDLNPALDLGPRDPFTLDLGDGNGPTAYPRNWPREDMAARLGFAAYEPEQPPTPEPVPEDCPLTRLQLRKALLVFFGVTAAQIDALIAQTADPVERELAAMTWQDAQTYNIGHPLIALMSAALGLDSALVRARWMQAANEDWTV